MKHLFLLAVCCAFFVAAKAQVTMLNIQNNRPHDVHVVLYGDNGCGGRARTGLITLTSGANYTGVPTSTFTWAPFTPTHFVYAVVYEGNPGTCPGVGSTIIGEACGGFVQQDWHNHLDNTCTVYAPNPLLMSWITISSTLADLQFQP